MNAVEIEEAVSQLADRAFDAGEFAFEFLAAFGKKGTPRLSCASRTRGAMADIDLDELRAELDEFAQPQKKGGRSPREERIIAGFEDILRFVETHGHPPRHGEERDIFERLYAVRLDRIRAQQDCREIVAPLDRHGLL